MSRTSSRTRRSLVAVATTGVLAVGVVVPALAQDDPPDEQVDTSPEERRAAHQAAFAEALAAELGLDTDTVAEALAAVREAHRAERAERRRAALADRLDEAVEAGDLTEEQAEALLDAEDARVLPFPHGRGHGGPNHRGAGPGHGRGGPFPPADTGTSDAPDPAA